MDADDENRRSQSERDGDKKLRHTDMPPVEASGGVPKSSGDPDPAVRVTRLREGSEAPTGNPDFSVAGLNPAFTHASAPPPQPPDEAVDAQRDARIRELERLLAQASEQIERGAAALERSRKRR